jgi:epoxyqueuosine reductase
LLAWLDYVTGTVYKQFFAYYNVFLAKFLQARMDYTIKQDICNKGLEVGFDTVGFCRATLSPEAGQNLSGFLANNYHGEMGWMEEKAIWRSSPESLWPEAKSVIMLGHNYAPDYNPINKLLQKNVGNISCYAQNEDYHDIIKKKLKQIAHWLVQTHGGEVKVFVDTAPVMEKPLAQNAGLGWQGKHTCVVSREFGSWLFLGAIFTTLELEPDAPAQYSCGSCNRCIDICPTNAFDGAGKIDARKCISYLTIENKGQIPLEFRKAIGNRIYGCDDCLAVCPWNKFAKTASESAYHPRENIRSPLLADLAALDDAAFREMFRKSPVKRIGRERFIRNVLVAIGNSEDAGLLPVAQKLEGDPSPLVSEMASWAMAELMDKTQE